jgi:hypothetical protein
MSSRWEEQRFEMDRKLGFIYAFATLGIAHSRQLIISLDRLKK